MGVLHRIFAVFRRRRALTTAAAVSTAFLLAGPAAAQTAPPPGPSTMLALPPAPLLPATLGKFSRVAEGDSGDGLGALDAPGFDPTEHGVLVEDGIKRMASSAYAPVGGNNKPGPPIGTINVYTFVDASGAVAAYDYFRKPGMRPEKLGDAAVAGGNQLVLRSGNSVVQGNLHVDRAQMEAITKELITHLPKISGPASITPVLPTLLPQKGLDADTEKYALGPAGYAANGGVLPAQSVGFDKSAETVTAKYKGGGTVTLALYPTPQIAGEHARAAQADLKSQGPAAGTVLLRREGELVVFTTGPWTEAAAKAMVEGIHLHQEISFDKPMPPQFHTEVQKTYTLLQSIAIFCLFGALAAIFLGLFFGGGRALIRVLQGKPAATEPEFLRIDLRGAVRDTPRHDA